MAVEALALENAQRFVRLAEGGTQGPAERHETSEWFAHQAGQALNYLDVLNAHSGEVRKLRRRLERLGEKQPA